MWVKQHAVTLKLDGAVKAYEAAKALKKTTQALTVAGNAKDKAAAKKHLKKYKKAGAFAAKHGSKVAKAVQNEAANKGKGKPPAKASGHLKRKSEIQFMLQRAARDIADVV